ncbi:hypothetical protein Hanom_Chr06g00488241 [Helianthus anomalus]
MMRLESLEIREAEYDRLKINGNGLDTSTRYVPTLETFRKRPRRVPMMFPSPTSTRDGYGHINGVPVLHRLEPILEQ